MIGLNPAFEIVRKHKKVEPETESLVLKRTKGRISQDEMITAFEKGLSGDYGKFIVADPQTLMTWINKFLANKNNSGNYLEAGLLDKKTKVSAEHYPAKVEDWWKEANKCFTAFLNGVDCVNFHPHVYDRMMLDGKILINSYKKYLAIGLKEPNTQDEINIFFDTHIMLAKQMMLKEIFTHYRKNGWKSAYIIPEKTEQ